MHIDNVAPFDELEIPIAIQKVVRSYTQHLVTNHLTCAKLSVHYKAFITKIDGVEIPRDVQNALDDPYWKVAVLKEMNDLTGNDTWEIFYLPKDKKVVGCKWVLTINYKSDGTIKSIKRDW